MNRRSGGNRPEVAGGASTVTRPDAGAAQASVGPAGRNARWVAGGGRTVKGPFVSPPVLADLDLRPYADVARQYTRQGPPIARTAQAYQPPNALDLHGVFLATVPGLPRP